MPPWRASRQGVIAKASEFKVQVPKLTTILKLLALVFLVFNIVWGQVHSIPTQTRLSDKEAGSAVLAAGAWNSPQDVVPAQEIAQALEQGPEKLFNLLSKDLRETFDQANFEAAIGAISIDTIEITEPFTEIDDEWAELTVKLTLTDGTTVSFLVILHHEPDGWRIFGTEEL
ncbi:hypothetical protein KKB83_01395 [Patescibacteria group bacterium]|nr:hypothetical protein [Patescibacteria group bacterium]